MRLRTAAPLILGSTFVIALVAIACGGDINSIVQTTTAEQKIANVTSTAEVLIAAGIDPSIRNVSVGQGSLAEQVVKTQEAERIAAGGTLEQLVELPNGEFVAPAIATQFAEFGTEDQPLNPPDGSAESGAVAVDILTAGKMVPAVLKITVGTTVTWTNTERTGHSTKSDPDQAEEWDSLDMARSILDREAKTFAHTFTTPGRYTYGSRVSGDSSLAVVFVE